MARERHRPGELPWGWWLRVVNGVLQDENGRTWRSVRDAFWQGELRFGDVHFAPEQHELMLRVLSSLDASRVGGAEGRHDIFGGDMMFWRFYRCWLASIGMIDAPASWGGTADPLQGGLTPEGRSVLKMLRATREPAWEELPMAQVLEAVASAGRGAAGEVRECALKAFEESVGFRRHVFAREQVAGSHLVTLTGLASGAAARMPTRRVTWSVSFANADARDDLFAWLAARIDRWDDWGATVYGRGAETFTRHLLGLVVASRTPGSSS